MSSITSRGASWRSATGSSRFGGTRTLRTPRAFARTVGRGLVGDDLDAAVAAEQIHAALDAREPATHLKRPSPNAGNSPADLDAELSWLLKVTKHFTKRSARPGELADTDLSPTGGIA